VHQDLGLIESMSVRENMAMGYGYARRWKFIDWAAVDAAADAAKGRRGAGDLVATRRGGLLPMHRDDHQHAQRRAQSMRRFGTDAVWRREPPRRGVSSVPASGRAVGAYCAADHSSPQRRRSRIWEHRSHLHTC
jgi:hypothetical protein